MDFAFSPEEERFRNSIRDFCEETIVPIAGEIDEKGEIPRDIIQAMGARGILAMTVSEEYAGAGAGFMKAAIATEEIARADTSMAAFEIIKDVMIWHGAYVYTKEAGLERGLRGVMSYLVGAEGAMNIMRTIIGKELLGKDFGPVQKGKE
ncbi:MAG: acyl-CoA dehydrogenase family protein [Nitrospiraceae bacterium]|nr:acyl-CoA dehydrogenase family protein [Nitrospiraceae bacterium]